MPETTIYASRHPQSAPTPLHAQAYEQQRAAEPNSAIQAAVWAHFGTGDIRPVRPDTEAGKDLIDRVVDICIAKKIRNLPDIFIINSPVANAASVSGHSLIITTRLLEIMSPEALSAIIGHELSHHRHFMRDAAAISTLSMVGAWAARRAMLAGTSQLSSASMFNNRLLQNAGLYLADFLGLTLPIVPYRHFMEYESDREGAQATQPQQMIEALRTLEAEMQAKNGLIQPERSLGNRIVKILTYPFSTHPPMDKRIATLEKMQPKAEIARG